MVTRRNFLAGMLAAASAPAIVKAENMMKIFVPKQEIIIPSFSRGAPTALGGSLTKYPVNAVVYDQWLKDIINESIHSFTKSFNREEMMRWERSEREGILNQRGQVHSRGMHPLIRS